MVNKDALWKGIIEDLVEEFVHYFFADFIEQIDIERGFVSMNKELKQLSNLSESRLRHADTLFKAWLKDGQEQWFLVHVEVQGYPDAEFAKRMYQYAYRIQDRFDRPLTALAIYTDTNTKYHFEQYEESFLGTELIYRFHTYVLIDQEPLSLEVSNNLFALVMEIARREVLYKKKGDRQRFQFLIELVRYLFQQGIDKLKIRYLLDFIKCYARFDHEGFFNKFEEEIQLITKSRQAMGIRQAILQDVKETGFEEGQAEGRVEGRAEGQAIKERIVVKRAWIKGLDHEEIADLADMPLEKVETIIQELTNEIDGNVTVEGATEVSGIEEKKQIAIINAWKKDLPIEEIAELAGMSISSILAIIQEWENKSESV